MKRYAELARIGSARNNGQKAIVITNCLDSKYFVPQHRERVFIVGHLRGRHTSKVLPIEGANGKDCANQIKQVGHLAVSLRHNPDRYRVYDPTGICSTLNKMEGGGREPHIVVGAAALRGRGGYQELYPDARILEGQQDIYINNSPEGQLGRGKDWK